MTATVEEVRAIPQARVAWYQNKNTRALIGKVIVFTLLATGAVLFLCPVVWMFVSSLKTNFEVFDGRWIPRHPAPPLGNGEIYAMWNNFPDAWSKAPFGTYLRNTALISAVSVTGSVLSSSLVAYSFARLRFPGREAIFICVLATMLLPGVVMFIPQYILWSKLGFVNTFVPLAIPAWFGSAFFIFLLRQFYRGIPNDLSDAARIDGAGEFRIWWQLVMPLSRPALMACTIFAFTGAWEDYFGPLIYLSDQSKYTLQLGLQVFEAYYGGAPAWNYLMAVGFIIMAPVILLFFLGQRYFIEGVTLTGLKG